MKRYLLLLFCATALILCGCSKDDERGGGIIDARDLIGKWELYMEYDADYGEWDDEFGEEAGCIVINEYHEDGSGFWTESDYPSHILRYVPFTYKVDGNMLRLYYDDRGVEEVEEARIEKLTASELVLAYDYEIDGKNYTDKGYYKRIN